jgi:hypothetical protein
VARKLYSRDGLVHYVSGRGAVVGWKEIDGTSLFAIERQATKVELKDAIRDGKFVNHSTRPAIDVIAELMGWYENQPEES